MDTLRVFLAPDGPAGGVPGVLADLSAAGLVAPYLWVTASGVRQNSARAVAVADGRRRTTTVEDELSTGKAVHTRLCVVVPLGGAVVGAHVESLLSELIQQTGHAPTPPTRIRCIVGRLGEKVSGEDFARAGWHNVYVAPEDAEGPVGGRVVLDTERADVVDSGRHAAPTIAGIVGLWTGVDECVFDDDTVYLPGARAARCFYRRVDAAEVEHDLRRRVLATAGGVPRPRKEGTEAAYVTDPGRECAEMTRRWWALHEKRVIGPTKRAAPFEPERLTIKAALLMFGRWLRETVLRRPRDLVDTAHNLVKIKAAAAVSKALFSGDQRKAYEIVVHGRTGNLLPVGLSGLREPAEELDRAIVASGGAGQGVPGSVADLSPMWRDYASAAFTLVDGGERSSGLQPAHRDGRPAVLSSPELAVPAAAHAFEVPGSIASRPGMGPELHRILPGDLVAVRRLQAILPELAAEDVTLRNEVADVQVRLARWSARHERSFAGQVGARIDDERVATVHRIGGYLHELEEAASFRPDPPANGRGKAFWIVTGLLAVVLVPALLLLLWLYAALIPWWAAVVPVILVPLGWAGWGALEHGRDLWELEQAGKRVSAVREKLEAAITNLRQSLLDLRALAAAYEQYRVYTSIVGAVLVAPYGAEPEAPHRPAAIAYGLPRSVRVAWGQATEASVGAAAEQLRRETFQTSWLSDPWDAHCALAGRRLDSYALQQDGAGAMFDLQGSGVAGSDLQRWSDLLAAEGTSAEPGEARWRELLDDIRGRGNLDAQLLSSVQEIGRDATTLDDFLAEIDQPDEAAGSQMFRRDHFTQAAQVDSAHMIRTQRKLTEQGLGLSRVHVLVQLGQAVPARDFAATARVVAAPRAVVPEPPPLREVDDPAADDGGPWSHNGQAPPPSPPSVPPVPEASF